MRHLLSIAAIVVALVGCSSQEERPRPKPRHAPVSEDVISEPAPTPREERSAPIVLKGKPDVALAETHAVTTADKVSTAPDDPSLIKVSAADLVDAYGKNEAKADEIYKGQVLRVSGVVGDVGKDVAGNMFVTLRVEKGMNVQAYFAREGWAARIASLQNGTPIEITGRCAGKSTFDVVIMVR